jgi:hypothetical protein
MGSASVLRELLSTYGIARVEPVFSPDALAFIDATLNPPFAERTSEARSYVYADELHSLGLFETVFNDRVRDLLLSIMPDPVLYHCHVYEIAARNTRSHIFSENSFAGWHRDPDSGYVEGEPTHVSVFIYLTDVSAEDGPFEFIPVLPTGWLRAKTPYDTIVGPRGTTFAWHRSFYHRAAPNRGAKRRRVLKISIQRNAFLSAHLKDAHFQYLAGVIPRGNDFHDMLLGRFQGSASPNLQPSTAVDGMAIASSAMLGDSGADLLKGQARAKAAEAKAWLRSKVAAPVASYD